MPSAAQNPTNGPPGNYPLDTPSNGRFNTIVEGMEQLTLTANQRRNRRRRLQKKNAKALAEAENPTEVKPQDADNRDSQQSPSFQLPKFDFEAYVFDPSTAKHLSEHLATSNNTTAEQRGSTRQSQSADNAASKTPPRTTTEETKASESQDFDDITSVLKTTPSSPRPSDEPTYEIISKRGIPNAGDSEDVGSDDDFEIIDKSEARWAKVESWK